MTSKEVFALAIGVVVGAMIVVIFHATRADYICEYEGGEMKADVCIVDGKVFDIE